jgi:predicted small lipoprotein YifL
MKKLIALVLATLMVCAVFAGCGSKTPAAAPTTAPTTAAPTEPTTEPTEPTTEPTEPTTEPTEEPTEPTEEPTEPIGDVEVATSYDEVFSMYNIVDMPALFMGLDSMSFAVGYDGMIEKIELGYKDDIVYEMVNVVYYPLEGLTEDEIASLDTSMKELMAPYADLECCSDSSFTTSNNYYIISLTFSNLDNADNVKALEELDLIESDGTTGLCSITASEESLIANGYLKK